MDEEDHITIQDILATYDSSTRPTENFEDHRTRLLLYALDCLRVDILAALSNLQPTISQPGPTEPLDLSLLLAALSNLPAPTATPPIPIEQITEAATRAVTAALVPELAKVVKEIKGISKQVTAGLISPSGSAPSTTTLRDANNPDRTAYIDSNGFLHVIIETTAPDTTNQYMLEDGSGSLLTESGDRLTMES